MVEQSKIDKVVREVELLQNGYMKKLGNSVIDNLGRYDGKYSANVSLASHILNSTLIGMNAYVYEKTIIKGENVDEDEFRMLTAALTLHDVNKIVSAMDDEKFDRNTREVLERYFEDDILGIDSYLEDQDDYFEDLLYLIQRTETGENATQTRGYNSEYSGLEAYCELGDGVSSAITCGSVDDGYDRLERMFLHTKDDHVQMLRFYRTGRPIMTSTVLQEVKDVIQDSYGLVVGSSLTQVIYLGDEVTKDEIRKEVSERVKSSVAETIDLNCTADWQKVSYGILGVVGIDLDDKRSKIANEFADTVLRGGQAGVTEVEEVPDKIMDNLPEMLHRIYEVGDHNFESDSVQELWDETKDDVGGMKVKAHFMGRLCHNFNEYEDEIEQIVDGYKDILEDVLTVKISPSEEAVRQFFEGPVGVSVDSSNGSCFICGSSASKDYKDPNLYGTNAFSKRVGVEQKYKKICETCMLEESLIRRNIEESDQYLDDLSMIFFYYDDFVAEIHRNLKEEKINILDDTIDFNPESEGLGAVSLMNAPIHVQPLSLGSGQNESDGNKKMRVVREVLKKIQSTGMKATISTPFKPFRSDRLVFRDLNPIVEQLEFGLAEVERFGDLERLLAFLQICHEINGATNKNSPYLEFQMDDFLEIVHKSVLVFDDIQKRKSVKRYCKNHHSEEYMSMKEVARNGFELYRTSYNDSKHKKTSVFREAVESVMTGLNQGVGEEELRELVAGRVMTAANRQQDGNFEVGVEQVEEFVDSLIEYLEDNSMMELQELSDRENNIIDAYYYTYEDVLNEEYGDKNDN